MYSKDFVICHLAFVTRQAVHMYSIRSGRNLAVFLENFSFFTTPALKPSPPGGASETQVVKNSKQPRQLSP